MIFTPTELVYSNDIGEPLAVYILDQHGYHNGPVWFRRVPKRADEWNPAEMKAVVEAAIERGFEVRICNTGDFAVYHAKNRAVIYPEDEQAFWRQVL
jgi:hypothetical protein